MYEYFCMQKWWSNLITVDADAYMTQEPNLADTLRKANALHGFLPRTTASNNAPFCKICLAT